MTTDVPGCREIVRHGENGLLVPPRDPGALAAALRELLTDPGRRREMGRRGRERVEDRFTDAHVIEATLRVYDEILSRNQGVNARPQ